MVDDPGNSPIVGIGGYYIDSNQEGACGMTELKGFWLVREMYLIMRDAYPIAINSDIQYVCGLWEENV